MDQMNQNPMQPQQMMPGKPKASTGSLIAIVIILGIIIVGGIYYFMTSVPGPTPTDNQQAAAMDDTQAAASVQSLSQQSSSDALSDIEKDANATDLTGLDKASSDINTDVTTP